MSQILYYREIYSNFTLIISILQWRKLSQRREETYSRTLSYSGIGQVVPGLAQRESDVKDTHLLTSHRISPHLMSCPKAVRHPMFPHQLSNTLPPGCPSQNCTRARSQITVTPLHSQAFPSHPIPTMGFKWRQICKRLKYQGFPSSSLSPALEFDLITSLITRLCGESTVLSKEMQDLEKQQNKDNKTLHVIHCALQRKRLENRTICSYLFSKMQGRSGEQFLLA